METLELDIDSTGKQNPLDEMFGLWKDRLDISIEKIREQAWPKRVSIADTN